MVQFPRILPMLTLLEFVNRWKNTELTERAAAQTHFIDLCDALGEPHPAAVDQSGETYTFEKGVTTTDGGQGFADVWKRGYFAWEYKGKHKDLKAAYQQLLRYCEDLENPPLLVVCDMDRFEVHTKFTATAKQVYRFSLDDLVRNEATPDCALPPLDVLRALFRDPTRLRPDLSAEDVTKQAADRFASLADSLRARGTDPQQAAHFLMRLLFCLFAEDIGLLPSKLFSKLIEHTRQRPAEFKARLSELFRAMATGGSFGVEDIAHFNGDLFTDAEVLDLSASDLGTLSEVSKLDWSSIEPAIFGTLFERSLDPDKRSQLGAHYTSRDDILLIVEPVLMAPLRRLWAEVKAKAESLLSSIEPGAEDLRALEREFSKLPLDFADAKQPALVNEKKRELIKKKKLVENQIQKIRADILKLLRGFLGELSSVRVLDPACGSGNFLYVSLKLLLDLAKEVSVYGFSHQVGSELQFHVTPSQLYGIEKNVYAHELASVVVWIGYLQWLNDNGSGWPAPPILQRLDNIHRMDAVLAYDDHGKPIEPEWPAVDVIVGNPPFLGGKKMRDGLGDQFVDDLFKLYDGRVPREADFVTYWFEKARALIASDKVRRAGLLATQGIRGGANRKVLERIKETGDIFWAQSDRDWILDGANVHVSMIGFDNGSETARELDGKLATSINSNLTGSADLTKALPLPENLAISFMGDTKGGSFDLSPEIAQGMLAAPVNPNGRPNTDVVVPWVNGSDITGRSRGGYIIDFGADMTEQQAALYEMPFAHVRRTVKPKRDVNKRKSYRRKWWIHVEPRPEMRERLAPLQRFVITPRVAKHRIFAWVAKGVLADSASFVFARTDDYFFGVLHSRVHELWALRKGTALEDRPRYTPTSTFETFPFPWPPGKEPPGDPRVKAIAAAAKDLVAKRDAWLNPPGVSPPDVAQEALKKRTLTNLYNQRPQWLDDAHRALDKAVLAAYGWPENITDPELLERLLALNLQRAG